MCLKQEVRQSQKKNPVLFGHSIRSLTVTATYKKVVGVALEILAMKGVFLNPE